MAGRRGAARAVRRLERRDWIEAARQVFATEGVEKVNIVPLSASLGVTRGSFYWHFGSRQALLDELVVLWQQKNTRALVEAATRPVRDFPERFMRIMRCWIDPSLYDPGLDLAMRDWARRDPRALAQVQAADEERIAAFSRAFEERGESPRMAFIRARTVYYMQVGYYAVGIAESVAQRLQFIGEYYEAFVGEPMNAERAQEWIRTVASDMAVTGTTVAAPRAGRR
ncbi:MAG: TetR/AcrR family transcriptional regulator [Rhodospirillales bacterium]|nr:TetR/AcrR family transcriptional regulator [Rhodospirillales bacterium]